MHELTFASTALMICVAAGAYLAGCCNGAIITSFLFYRDDIRRHGSHNAGLTNFYRVYGKKFAICVILVDMLKAFVAVSSARLYSTRIWDSGWRASIFPLCSV